MKIATLAILFVAAAFGQAFQNSDFGWLAGAVHVQGEIVAAQIPGGAGVSMIGPPVNITGSTGFAFQVSFAHQLAATSAGSVYFELPETFFFSLTGTVQGATVTSLDRDSNYFTPGVRFKFPTGTRLSFYAAAGGGFEESHESYSVVNGQSVATSGGGSYHGAVDFGGGLDVRISRWLSLRVDARDYVGFGPVNHRPAVLAGFAFHL